MDIVSPNHHKVATIPENAHARFLYQQRRACQDWWKDFLFVSADGFQQVDKDNENGSIHPKSNIADTIFPILPNCSNYVRSMQRVNYLQMSCCRESGSMHIDSMRHTVIDMG